MIEGYEEPKEADQITSAVLLYDNHPDIWRRTLAIIPDLLERNRYRELRVDFHYGAREGTKVLVCSEVDVSGQRLTRAFLLELQERLGGDNTKDCFFCEKFTFTR